MPCACSRIASGSALHCGEFWARCAHEDAANGCNISCRQRVPKLLTGCAGEHTCIVIRPLASAEVEGTAWLQPFVADFRVRLMALLPSAFKCAPMKHLYICYCHKSQLEEWLTGTGLSR